MKNKQQTSEKVNEFEYIPFLLALILIPFLIVAVKYDNGLSSYAWYSTNTISYDFFLYIKSRMLMITAFVAIIILIYRMYQSSKQRKESELFPIMFWVPIVIYAGFVLLSSVFSENISFAFLGSAEQFEGALTLFAYCILSCYAFYFVKYFEMEEKVFSWITIGAFLVSLVGAFQFAGLDFYRTSFAKVFITALDSDLANSNFDFNFALGRTYSSLYNPNYVGSYVALLLPVIIASAIVCKKSWVKLLATVSCGTLILSLVGSESMTGYLAIIAIVILFAIYSFPRMKKYPKYFGMGVIATIVIFVILIAVKKDAFDYGVNKIFHSENTEGYIQSITTTKNEGIHIYKLEGKTLNVKTENTNGKISFVFTNQNNEAVSTSYDSEKDSITITAGDFKGIQFKIGTVTIDNQKQLGFEMVDGSKTWRFVIIDGTYKFYSNYGKASPIYEVPRIGFENSEHFASRRGYIWSRTLPLVGEHIFLGSGPDTFVLEFPNDDFVGMVNNNYSGNMVTKPHNMYLQIAVQTGLVSLLAFLAMYILYLVSSVRLYWKRELKGLSVLGISCMLGSTGYMITGLANDSSVAVAPLFWMILGVGTAINSRVKNDKQN